MKCHVRRLCIAGYLSFFEGFVGTSVTLAPAGEGARGRTSRQDDQPHDKQSRQSKTDCHSIPVYRLGILAITLKGPVERHDSYG